MPSAAKVMAVLFACEPDRGSEPGVGYEYLRGLAELSMKCAVDVVAYTRPHRLSKINDRLARDVPGHRVRVVGIPVPRAFRKTMRGPRRTRLVYVLWQLSCVKAIRRDLTAVDARIPVVVHHLTFATVALPTWERFITRNSGVLRHVVGPAGSSAMIKPLTSTATGHLAYHVRLAVGRRNVRPADLVVANGTGVQEALLRAGARVVVVAPNAVVDVPDGVMDATRNPHGLVCVGNLVAPKRQELVIRCLAHLDESYTLTIVGDGPQRDRLKELARELGVTDRVTLAGKVPRAEALRLMASAKVLVHASVSEGSSWVIAEAQTVGTVPVSIEGTGADSTTRLGGLGVVVREATPQALAQGVRDALLLDSRPVTTWSRSRLPHQLRSWYEQVLGASLRPATTRESEARR